ncbi:hypothetical protein [Paenibacillus sp. HB172176]|uniref:hypothetical protein n=1 Tax=Paenibacillus sp. HB172176 TaxID=2493690 RepID=UPI00143A69B0|nr:hypothetical protein [Paenibacillus sp. HB172176]
MKPTKKSKWNKKTKWTKWQIGAGSALLIALFFSQVKSSDAFQAATEGVAGNDQPLPDQESSQSYNDDEHADAPSFDGEGFTERRSHGRGRQMEQGSEGSQSQGSGGSQSQGSGGSQMAPEAGGNGSGSSSHSSSGRS